MRDRHNARRLLRRAFTLIEMLVVLAIVSVMVGLLGLALRGSDDSQGLRAGQSILASMLTAARGAAALENLNAYFLVNVDPANSARHLRYLYVVVEDVQPNGAQFNPRRFRQIGPHAVLPPNVYFVSSNIDAFGVAWTGVRSDPGQPLNLDLPNLPFAAEGTGPLWHGYRFTPHGTTAADDLVLTVGRQTGETTFELPNINNVAGARIRQLGAFTLVNGVADFGS